MQTQTPLSTSAFLLVLSCHSYLSSQVFATPLADKRAPFSSWAGKRSGSPMVMHQIAEANDDLTKLIRDLRGLYLLEDGASDLYEEDGNVVKRAPFSSWAGKRAPFSSWAGKRAPFSSWAGKKRSSEEFGPESHRFKRSSVEMENEEEELGQHSRQRRGANSFSAWGGKRADGLRRFARNAPVVRVLRPQRAAFSAWGG